MSTSTSINVVNSMTDERRHAHQPQQQTGGGASSRIYRELEAGYSSGSSRAGSTGGAVVRPATLDFTDIGEEAALSDDNLCEEQPMVNLFSMTNFRLIMGK